MNAEARVESRHPVKANRLGETACRAMLGAVQEQGLGVTGTQLFSICAGFAVYAASRRPGNEFDLVPPEGVPGEAPDYPAEARFLRALARHLNAVARELDPIQVKALGGGMTVGVALPYDADSDALLRIGSGTDA